MAASNALSIKDIVSLREIPLILEKCFSMDAFVMGHHVYKETWNPSVGEELDTAMQPNNVKEKYAVAVHQKGKQVVIGHLPFGHSGKFAKTIFDFFKASKENRCKIVVTAKVVKYISILKEKIPKLL